MRVLHLTTEFPPLIYGGLGTAIGGLVRASAQAGIEVTVMLVGGSANPSYSRAPETPQLPDAAAELTWDDNPGVHVLHTSHQEAERVGVRWLRHWRPDVLHLHSFWLWPLARALRMRTGVPIVYTVHSLDRAEYEIGQGPPECLTQWDIQQELIASADLNVALTRSERELILTYCPAARDRVRIVGNGIEDTPDALAFSQSNRTNNPVRVLFSGRFVERKGVRELLEAIPMVLDYAPDAHFVLAGGHRNCSGDDMARHWLPPGFERYKGRVHFAGWLSPERLARLYREVDVLVVPSWYEPFGMVVLEGMLFGLSIAASSVGGPAEILDNERTGLLFPPRDATALAQALIRLIEAPALRHRLGQAAAREVRHKWLYSRVIEQMRAVYAEATATMIARPQLPVLPVRYQAVA